MSAVKQSTVIWSGVSNGAGNTTTSTAQNCTTSYGDIVAGNITNGGTGPTVAGQVQLLISADGSTYFPYGGPFVGGTTNSAVYPFAFVVPYQVSYYELQASGNTGQAVTVNAAASRVVSQ